MSPKTVTGAELELDDAPARSSELFLVDGNNLAYRAFYALPEELATTDGFPTNALLGFTNMLFKLLADYRPKGVAVAWDTRPVHRTEISEAYKAERKPMPDLLREQFPHFRPIVEAFGYSNLEFEGWEADDVIATLATRADAAGVRTCVVSTDRDAFQLCSENVCLMMTPRGVSDVQVYTPERVEARYGVRPDQVPDFIGLKGDTSDNIPGVPGIGDKTAAQLIAQYGSLEAVLEHAAEQSPARAKALTEFAQQARDSKLLATMRRDLEIDCDPRRARPRRARPIAAEGDLPPLRVPRRPQPRGRAGDRFAFGKAVSRGNVGALARGRGSQGGEGPRRLRGRGRPLRGRDRRGGRRRAAARRHGVTRRARRPRREVAACRRARRHDARRLPDRARTGRVRARRAGRGVRRRGRPRPAGRGGDGGARPARRDTPPSDRADARAPPRARLRAALPRDRAAADTPSSRRWRTPASGSTPTAWARSRRGSPTASRSSRRRRRSSPASRSCSARPSRWRASCSRSSG